ncbi:hypothetical protein HOF67_02650 [Candidatus Peregrinibacteria bacterium]|jgi:hypothetical protein|nr:hypothetical protein [Candidatus Peregrinibacteria bacterium]
MKKKNYLKINPLVFVCGLVISGYLFASIVGAFSEGSLFQGSVLSLFNKIGVTDYQAEYPDLGIEKITLIKSTNPSGNFPYYKYKATVVLRNYGEGLDKAEVTINAGKGQKSAFVRNELYGLTLPKGERFIFDDYEVLMAQGANYKSFDFEIDVKDQGDRDAGNNSYTAGAFEEPANLQSFEISAYDNDEDFDFDYRLANKYEADLSEAGMLMCVAENYRGFEENDMRYAEVDTTKDVYSYYKIKASEELIVDEEFECDEVRANAVREDFDLDEEYVVFLKGVLEDGSFAVSNALYLPEQEYMNRAEFTKLFVDYTGLEIYTDGQYYYKDVFGEEWYAPYVQTMFNHGLLPSPIDFRFRGDDAMHRGDILEPLLHYFDADLFVEDGAPHFHDVQKNSDDYFFVESLYSNVKASSFGIYFHPDKRASRHFLKYLIDEFANE